MTPNHAASDSRPAVAWVGAAHGPELEWARAAVAELVDVRDVPDVDAAEPMPFWPAFVLLGSDASACWQLADLTTLARRWPLAPLVSVATSLVEGRRRSGPALPATEEVPWSELPARLATWLAVRAADRPGTPGLPATARREDRMLEAVAALAPAGPAGIRLSVAAQRPLDLDGLADLLAAAGHEVVRRSCGRPPLDEPADVLVWDAGTLDSSQLAWLGLLTANRPGLRIVVIDSFPRSDTALAALRAGAAAVIGRPIAPESLAGALGADRPTGLGPPGRSH